MVRSQLCAWPVPDNFVTRGAGVADASAAIRANLNPHRPVNAAVACKRVCRSGVAGFDNAHARPFDKVANRPEDNKIDSERY